MLLSVADMSMGSGVELGFLTAIVNGSSVRTRVVLPQSITLLYNGDLLWRLQAPTQEIKIRDKLWEMLEAGVRKKAIERLTKYNIMIQPKVQPENYAAS